MLVTKVEQQKKDAGRYSVFIEGEYAFSLCQTDIAYFKIKEGAELKKETIDYLLDSLTYIRAQETAMKYLGYKARTAKEVERKLLEKEYSHTVTQKVLEFLGKYGYINDHAYCDAYIRESVKLKPKGSYLLKRELKARGVQEEIIDAALEEAKLDELSQAVNLLQKKREGKQSIDEKEKQRAIAFLCRRGYRYELILEALRKMEVSEDFC